MRCWREGVVGHHKCDDLSYLVLSIHLVGLIVLLDSLMFKIGH